jgi:triacylglycerol lipase
MVGLSGRYNDHIKERGKCPMGFVVFLAFVVIFLFFPVSTYILFWYETANSAYRDELARLSHGRTGSWVTRGIVSSILSNMVTVCTYPLGLISRLWEPAPGSGASSPPVILIHGLYHNPSAWIRLRGQLKRAGYDRVYAFKYSSFRSDFQGVFRGLEQWITEIGRGFPGESVILVGHSMGGLLAKAYAAREDPSQGPRAQAVITLGTPFGGSKAVVFGIGNLARSLGFGGTLIHDLEGRQTPAEVPCIAFHSPVDNMVLPAESLRPPADWQEEVTAPLCHLAMLYHGPTVKRVLNRINETAAPTTV